MAKYKGQTYQNNEKKNYWHIPDVVQALPCVEIGGLYLIS